MTQTENTIYQSWSADEQKRLVSTARGSWRHGSHADQVARDNCPGCALEADNPNYAGWLRIYIQLGKPVSPEAYGAEIAAALDDNPRYYEAVMRDIATWGVKFK